MRGAEVGSMWVTLLLLGASGCRMTLVEPLPLSGPAPASISVWPTAETSIEGPAAAGASRLLEGLDAAVRSRGYRVPSLAVARQLLADAAPPGQPEKAPDLGDPAAVGTALNVDAVLRLEVRRFEADGTRLRYASWDLRWVLLSTRGHGELWSYEHAGSWQRRDSEQFDPHRALDAEPEYVPIGGDRQSNFHDVGELLAALHTTAMEHLPMAHR